MKVLNKGYFDTDKDCHRQDTLSDISCQSLQVLFLKLLGTFDKGGCNMLKG